MDMDSSTLSHFCVLIETYWNVKSGIARIFFTPAFVLIETYWNVKSTDIYIQWYSDSVLIETYWNVKEDVQLFLKRLRSINRNILECKGK